MMTAVVLMTGLAFWGLPRMMAIYPPTLWTFPILAGAAVLDLTGSASEGRKWPWKTLGWVLVVVASITALWPLSGLWSALQGTYSSWTGAGYSIPKALIEALTSLQSYSATTQQAASVSLGLGLMCLALAITLPVRAAFDPKYRKDRKSRSGPWRAGWMKPSDVRYLASNKTGLPLAIHDGKLLRYKKNDAKGWRGGHHLVIAGTRGGKGVGAVIPAILDHQGPAVVLDVKGENFAVTRRYRASLGRRVAVLNPFSVVEATQDRFNPLDYVRPHELARDVDLIADGLVKNEGGDGSHFAEMAKQLVGAAIEVVVTQEKPERRTLITVMDLLLSHELLKTLEAWATAKDVIGHRPAQVAATLLAASDKERGAIQTTVSKAFAWAQADTMRLFLSGSTFTLDDILDDKLDIFIVVPMDQIEKQAVFMRLFINLVLGTVGRQDGRRTVQAPILLALDEFVRMGRMEQVINIATVAAGVGFEAMFITQDAGQVEKAYGKEDARAIFGSCITNRIFNLNDIETAEWVARHLGDGTVYSQQIKEDRDPLGGRDYSYAEQSQKLMTADQIRTMGAEDVLLLVGNRAPLKAKLNRFHAQQRYKGRYDVNRLG